MSADRPSSDPAPAPAPAALRAGGRLALALAVVVIAASLLSRGLFPPDEARYADVALAMVESGDWTVPRLHQKHYVEKPPVFFWCIAGLERLGVPLSMAPRVVSGLAALLLLSLLPAIGRAAGVPGRVARLAPLLLMTFPLFAIYAQLGFIDLLLAAFIAGAALLKLLRHRAKPGRASWLAMGEGLLLGLALLTKGPVALLFAAALRAGGALGGRDAPGRVDRRDALAVAVAVAVALAWVAAAAERAGWAYVEALIFGQLERRIGGTERLHRVWPGFLAVIVLVGGLPWTLLVAGGLRARRWREWRRPPACFAAFAGWAVVPIVLLACLPTQQPHYALPSLAPLLLLFAAGLAPPLRRWASIGAAAFGLLVGVGFLVTGLLLQRVLAATSVLPALAAGLAADHVLRGWLAVVGAAVVGAIVWPARGAARDAVLRGLLAVAFVLLGLPPVVARLDEYIAARSLVEDVDIRRAGRLVAPTRLRSLLRLATRLPIVEEYGSRRPGELLRADRDLVAVLWLDDAEREGLADSTASFAVVARGFAGGESVVAVRVRDPGEGR